MGVSVGGEGACGSARRRVGRWVGVAECRRWRGVGRWDGVAECRSVAECRLVGRSGSVRVRAWGGKVEWLRVVRGKNVRRSVSQRGLVSFRKKRGFLGENRGMRKKSV